MNPTRYQFGLRFFIYLGAGLLVVALADRIVDLQKRVSALEQSTRAGAHAVQALEEDLNTVAREVALLTNVPSRTTNYGYEVRLPDGRILEVQSPDEADARATAEKFLRDEGFHLLLGH